MPGLGARLLRCWGQAGSGRLGCGWESPRWMGRRLRTAGQLDPVQRFASLRSVQHACLPSKLFPGTARAVQELEKV